MKIKTTQWLCCAALSLATLFQARKVLALPALRCETIEIADHDSISRQLGLPELIESLKTIPLSNVQNGTPADIRVDFTFSSGSGRIYAAIHSWAEKDSVTLQSERVPWIEDFQARRRTIQPMKEADAQAFRKQIVEELTKQVEARAAAVAIASEPEGLPVVITAPEHAVAPINRNRTVAVLGCLGDGAELEGYVSWPDGRREPFKRRANQTPGRFLVGSPAPTGTAANENPVPTDTSTATTEPPLIRKKPASFSHKYWWLGGALVVALPLIARWRSKKIFRTR